jgi:phosphate-selective porin OprO/OprP
VSAPAEPASPPPLEPHEIKALVQDEIKKTKPTAGWKDGFFLESANGDFKLKLKGYVQAQARWFPNSAGDTGVSSFFLRRVRPTIEGTVFKWFDYKIMPDFGGTGGTSITVSIQDAYGDFKYFPYARFRAGKFKEPFSLERLQSGSDLLFVERSISNYLAPNRDVGFMLHGDLFDSIFQYQAGLFDGVVDGGSTDGDANSDKDFAGRLWFQPFITSGEPALENFGFGFAGTYGNDSDDPIDGTRVRTDGLSTIYKLATDTLGNGIHSRFSPQFYYYWGPFGMMGEYIYSHQSGRLSKTNDDDVTTTKYGSFTNQGGMLQASYLLTGDNATYKSVTPIDNFDPANGRWGAFEVAARGSWVGLGNGAFKNGFASTSSSVTGANAYTFGLNWYFNKYFKTQLNYTRTVFDNGIKIDGAGHSREDVVLVQFQVAY